MTTTTTKCLQCQKPLSSHRLITEQDRQALAGATYHKPIVIDGYTFHSPIAACVVGQWLNGHRPMVARVSR